MYKLEVIADKLNIRNSPEADPTFANWIGDMNKGEIFTAARKVKGKIFEGTDDWYVDTFNRFISAGSTAINAQEFINDRFKGRVLTDTIDYNFLLNIDPTIKAAKGHGITIGILDHGISKDIQLKNEIVRPFNIDRPSSSHGSFIAGIIAGTNQILGITSDVTIIELPIYDEFGNIRKTDIIDQIFEFIASYPQKLILNVSQALEESFIKKFSDLKNAVMVAAAGVDDMLTGNDLVIPAKLPNTISVGSISADFKSKHENISFNDRLDFVFPVFDYVSYSLQKDISKSLTDTSSLSTAVVSSIIALLYSGQKINDSTDVIRQKVTGLSQAFSEKNVFNFLNPINLPK